MQRRARMFSEQAGSRRHTRRSCGSHGDRARRVQACKEGGGALEEGWPEQGAQEQGAQEQGALEQGAQEGGWLEEGAQKEGWLEQRAQEQRAPEGAPEGLRKQQR